MNIADIYEDFETVPPILFPSSDSLQLTENYDGELGLGYPQYYVLDSGELAYMISAAPAFSGSPGCFYTDIDGDGIKEMIASVGGDLTGDGINDFAYILDLNGNGIPDADPDSPFYPIDSPDYKRIISTRTNGGIIIISSDGTMSVYDPSGTLTAETYNEAYALWAESNGILNKPLDYFSVTEGLLALTLLFSVFNFVRGLFTRKDVFR